MVSGLSTNRCMIYLNLLNYAFEPPKPCMLQRAHLNFIIASSSTNCHSQGCSLFSRTSLYFSHFHHQHSRTRRVLESTAHILAINMPTFRWLKRSFDRAFSRSSSSSSTATSDSAKDTQVHNPPSRDPGLHRSSPKGSIYLHSPGHSGETLHDAENAPSHIRPDPPAVVMGSDRVVQTMTVGDSVITVETHPINNGRDDRMGSNSRPKSRRLRKRHTAPVELDGIASYDPLTHGSVTTVETVPTQRRPRAFSHPQFRWKRLNFVGRARRSAELKEARKGKARSPRSSEDQEASPPTTPSRKRRSEISNMSPRASISGDAQVPAAKNDRSPNSHAQSQRPSVEDFGRKDSHFPDAVQAKEKETADLHALVAEQLANRSRKSSSFLRHPIDWIKQRRNSPASLPSSSSSSSSAFETRVIPSKVTRCPTDNDRVAQGKKPEPIRLPPGLEPPPIGHAGPSDWVHRGWEQYCSRLSFEESIEQSTRVPLRSSVARAEENQRAAPPLVWHPRADTPFLDYKTMQAPCTHGSRVRDFASSDKGKGVGRARPALVGGCSTEDEGRHRQLGRMRANGTCVTTLALEECEFRN